MRTKTFAEFYRLGTDGKVRPLVGSDGIIPMDGRYSKPTMSRIAEHTAKRLNESLNKGIVGYVIKNGDSYSNARIIQEYRVI